MGKIINFPDGKEVFSESSDKIDIIQQVGEELSLTINDDKAILTYPPDAIEKDGYWLLLCAVVFLFSGENGLDAMRDKVLEIAIKSGFPKLEKEIHFESFFDID